MEQALERRVRIIPATKKVTDPRTSQHGKQRVAAYCRVSTNNKEQINSYEAQKAYYTQKIEENPDWELAGIFADKGLSGASMKKRDNFNKMQNFEAIRKLPNSTHSLRAVSSQW